MINELSIFEDIQALSNSPYLGMKRMEVENIKSESY